MPKNDDLLAGLIAARAALPKSERRQVVRKKVKDNTYRGGAMTLGEFHRLAAQHTPAALKTLAAIMVTGHPKDQMQAAEILIKYAWGNPKEYVEHSGEVQVSTGAKERLALILERVAEAKVLPPAEMGIVEASFREVLPEKTQEKTEKAAQDSCGVAPTVEQVAVNHRVAGSSPAPTVLGPPPRKPGDE